ncbi:MAG: glyoxalase [Nitrospira sp. HN-bin3]|uniref:VOC family protein n=1 Tax=Nitrospira cf. moscoviensis SBR1015 TaxID=96242 RepID=UPI000A0CFBA4|nr:VOC family protein [Nitrospira cf. moscoviensis SBR1015]OQW39335.1 MAG: glyoxalase [Nitrospira sp. HN-bin3]
MAKKTTKRKTRIAQIPASICWFEVPADDLNRAQKFYKGMFGWTFNKLPAAINDYWHIDTGGPEASPDGGMMLRMHPQQPITNYISVPSVSKTSAKVEKLGGTVCKQKTAVPGMGYFAICLDTEGNTFALWEINERAK